MLGYFDWRGAKPAVVDEEFFGQSSHFRELRLPRAAEEYLAEFEKPPPPPPPTPPTPPKPRTPPPPQQAPDPPKAENSKRPLSRHGTARSVLEVSGPGVATLPPRQDTARSSASTLTSISGPLSGRRKSGNLKGDRGSVMSASGRSRRRLSSGRRKGGGAGEGEAKDGEGLDAGAPGPMSLSSPLPRLQLPPGVPHSEARVVSSRSGMIVSVRDVGKPLPPSSKPLAVLSSSSGSIVPLDPQPATDRDTDSRDTFTPPSSSRSSIPPAVLSTRSGSIVPLTTSGRVLPRGPGVDVFNTVEEDGEEGLEEEEEEEEEGVEEGSGERPVTPLYRAVQAGQGRPAGSFAALYSKSQGQMSFQDLLSAWPQSKMRTLQALDHSAGAKTPMNFEPNAAQ